MQIVELPSTDWLQPKWAHLVTFASHYLHITCVPLDSRQTFDQKSIINLLAEAGCLENGGLHLLSLKGVMWMFGFNKQYSRQAVNTSAMTMSLKSGVYAPCIIHWGREAAPVPMPLEYCILSGIGASRRCPIKYLFDFAIQSPQTMQTTDRALLLNVTTMVIRPLDGPTYFAWSAVAYLRTWQSCTIV